MPAEENWTQRRPSSDELAYAAFHELEPSGACTAPAVREDVVEAIVQAEDRCDFRPRDAVGNQEEVLACEWPRQGSNVLGSYVAEGRALAIMLEVVGVGGVTEKAGRRLLLIPVGCVEGIAHEAEGGPTHGR